MVEPSLELTKKLLELIRSTGYPIAQHNGQRKFGPPPNWSGPPPPRGSEVFVGKLPREVYEDELVPLFSTVGQIYEMRLMMDFSGSNRGYAFVTYTSRSEAAAAVRQLDGHEIRPARHLGVVKSVDNCRLYIGGIPKNKTKEEVHEELSKCCVGIVEVILYKNCFDRRLNRGFAFVEFTSHKAAAMARRELVPGAAKLWDQDVSVDWAEPEPDVDDDQMRKVRVLYARNFLLTTTSQKIQATFEKFGYKIERVKKIYDYAFIHFAERAQAEQAYTQLQGCEIEGVNIEIRWAKPVDRELYKIQKQKKGNAKFNNVNDLPQTLLLYKQHLDKKEYLSSKDEGISSGCAGNSSCESFTDYKIGDYENTITSELINPEYMVAPAKLDAMCRRYGWASPQYTSQRVSSGPGGATLFWSRAWLPAVGPPLLAAPRTLGPFASRLETTEHAATLDAAQQALNYLKLLRECALQQCMPLYCGAAPAPAPAWELQPLAAAAVPLCAAPATLWR